MAIPDVSEKRISAFVRTDLEKVLATLPQEGTDVAFDPVKVQKALAPTTKPNIPDSQPMILKEDILLTPPITKDVIIVPPPTTAETSSLLPLLVAGAILLMQ